MDKKDIIKSILIWLMKYFAKKTLEAIMALFYILLRGKSLSTNAHFITVNQRKNFPNIF